MKLRDAINEYAGWLIAIRVAHTRGFVDYVHAYDFVTQLQSYARAWIGEDLLNREL
jgi:hypothetical protein